MAKSTNKQGKEGVPKRAKQSLLTKEEIKIMWKGGKSDAVLHPDEMILGGDSRYINQKYKTVKVGKTKKASREPMQLRPKAIAKPPKVHQNLILSICTFINSNKTNPNHMALPEANLLDGDQYSPVPDVLVVDTLEETNLVAFELEQKAGIPFTIKLAQDYVRSLLVPEVFVIQYKLAGFIDFEITEIYRVNASGVFKAETFSEVLGLELKGIGDKG